MGTCHSTSSKEVPQPPEGDAGVYCIRKHGRAFAVYDPASMLVCVVLYLKGAREIVRRLGGVAVYSRDDGPGRQWPVYVAFSVMLCVYGGDINCDGDGAA